MGKFYSNANILLRRFSKCSIDLKCYFSRCIVQICIVHLSGMILVKEQWKKIKITYNIILRRLLALSKHNSASEMFVNLNIPSFEELLRKYVYSFQSRLIISDNNLLSGIFNSTTPLYYPIWDWWHTTLGI